MKYLRYLLPGILFLFGFCIFSINVKADTVEFNNLNQGTDLSIQEIFDNEDNKEYIEELQRLLFEKYESEYSTIYPYYVITIGFNSNNSKMTSIYLDMQMFSQPVSVSYDKDVDNGYGRVYLEDGTQVGGYPVSGKYQELQTSYIASSTTYNLPTLRSDFAVFAHYGFQSTSYLPSCFISSNFDIIFHTNHDSIVIHNFRDTGNDYILKSGDVLSTLFKGKDFTNKGTLVEVDLNSYPYIALSLKDYSKTEAFDVNNYVKGQYCITPVYDYGLKERREFLSQTQVERCSPYYNDFTLIRTTILKSDLDNHAIYYLKSYDTSKENKVKIDSSVFNIHYITEEEKDNPILDINGTKYSTLPFDKLTDTANKSESEGYVSGASGEIKVDWSDIFTSPLEFIKGIWSSVIQVFTVIGYFIALLPTTLQYFLYISFMCAVVLGLLKIIL